MPFSHSQIETFSICPYKYQLRYIEGLRTLPNTDANNALTIGLALHTGIEKGVREGLKSYFESFPILDDLQINEAIKLEYLIPKVRELVPQGTIFEQPINHGNFIGFIDALVPVSEDGMFKVFDLYDFKYSNHVDRYLESPQLHLYKYFYEKAHPFHKIRNLAYIFAPKTQIRQKKTEELHQFRKRLLETLSKLEVKTVPITYDPEKVIEFLQKNVEVATAKEFPKNECKLCDFCDYKEYCQQGVDYMILPKPQRRQIDVANRKKKVWLYGAPFSGKTTLADKFPDPVFLNTDGNIYSFTGTPIEIKERVEGRQIISAWAIFKDAIDALQKGSEFKTIVVDLVEDTFEHCRLYCYDKLGIEHESDNSFKAWDYVRTEFLSTIKRLMTLDYNVVLISHEDTTKDITRKYDKVTAIKPNIQEKTALKLAGMVDIVARVVADESGRTLQFKSDEIVFGGGRLKLTQTVIPLTYEALEGIYEAQGTKKVVEPQARPEVVEEAKNQANDQGNGDSSDRNVVDAVKSEVQEADEKPSVEQPVERKRKRRTKAEMEAARAAEEVAKAETESKSAEEQPKDAEQPKATEEVKKVTYQEMVDYAKALVDKYGYTEIGKLMFDRFGIKKFVELSEDQYANVMDELKKYEASKESMF